MSAGTLFERTNFLVFSHNVSSSQIETWMTFPSPESRTHPDGLLEDGDLPGEVVVLDLKRLDVRLDLGVRLLRHLPRLHHLLFELPHQHRLFLKQEAKLRMYYSSVKAQGRTTAMVS